MATVVSYLGLGLCIVALFSCSVSGRPATFLQDFRVTWSDSHLRQIEGGKAIQLILDQSSGANFSCGIYL